MTTHENPNPSNRPSRPLTAQRRRSRRRFGAVRRLKSGKYQARYPDASGRMISAGTFPTKGDADRFLAGIETDLQRGTWIDPAGGRTTFAEWCETFMATKAGKKPKTVASYESLVRSLLLPAFGKRRLDSLRTIDIERWMKDMELRGLGGSRRRQAVSLLGQMTKAAVRNGLVLRDPCAGVTKPKVPRPLPVAFTVEEVDALASETADRYKLLVYVLAYGGLRWGEAAGLRRRACDPLHSQLLVKENLSEVGGHLHWTSPKTHQERAVTLPSFVQEMLTDHLERFVDTAPDALVFTSPTGRPLRYSNFLSRVWRPALDSAGLKSVGTHAGRRTAATLLLAAGGDVKDVQDHLGHEDASTTLNNYCAVVESKRGALASRIDEVWRARRPAEKATG